MTTPVSAALVPTTPVFTNAERLALSGFLAGYSERVARLGVRRTEPMVHPLRSPGARLKNGKVDAVILALLLHHRGSDG